MDCFCSCYLKLQRKLICDYLAPSPESSPVKLSKIDAKGFHFTFDFSGQTDQAVTTIILKAVPVDHTTVQTPPPVEFRGDATSGTISSGLEPFTEYALSASVTRTGSPADVNVDIGTAKTWPAGGWFSVRRVLLPIGRLLTLFFDCLAPSQPLNVVARQTANSEVKVTWTPPDTKNGILDKYDVKCCNKPCFGAGWESKSDSEQSVSAVVKSIRTSSPIECWVVANVKPVPGMSITSLSTKSNATSQFLMEVMKGECLGSSISTHTFCVTSLRWI